MGPFDFTLAEALNQDTSFFFISDDLNVKTRSASFLKTVFTFTSTIGATDAGFLDVKHDFRVWLRKLIHKLESINSGETLLKDHMEPGSAYRESKVEIVWGGDLLTQEEILLVLQHDLVLAVISFVTVFAFTFIHTRSLFLTTLGLVQIAVTFPTALAVYFSIFGQEREA